MLTAEPIDKALTSLYDYLIDSPVLESEDINHIKSYIETANESSSEALRIYPELFSCIRSWYKQLNFDTVNIEKALSLIKDTNNVLLALDGYCRALRWPLSTAIPNELYNNIAQLLVLGKKKANLLEEALRESNLPPSSPKGFSLIDEVKEIVNISLYELTNKDACLAETRDEYVYLIDQLKKIQNCFSKSEDMDFFWQDYSEAIHFNQLMNTLLLTDEEKESWLFTYEYYRINNPELSNRNKLVALANYQMKGSRLTPNLLKEKTSAIVEGLYHQLIEKEVQTTVKDQWLDEIETQVNGSELNPLLHELMTLQQLFSLPEVAFAPPIQKNLDTLMALSKTTSITLQTNAIKVHELRQGLIQLMLNFDELHLLLQKKYNEVNEIIYHLEALNKYANHPLLKTISIDPIKLSSLITKMIDEIENKFINSFPALTEPSSGFNFKTYYEAMTAFIGEQKKETTKILTNFNQKGELKRTEALQKLKIFINKQEGLWALLLSFFSSNYRCCMAEINATIRSKETTLIKTEKITNLFEKNIENSAYFVRKRILFFAESNKDNMFIPKQLQSAEFKLR